MDPLKGEPVRCAKPIWDEAWVQVCLTLPVAGANLIHRSYSWLSLIAIGHLGKEILGPVSLSSSVNNLFGTSIVGGLKVGISTLASQAFGAGNDLAVALVLQRALLVALLGSLPCVLLLVFIKPILLCLHMDEGFATVAGRYAYCVLLVTPFMGIQRSIGMWLVAQKNNHPRMWVILLALPLHAMMTVYFTFSTSWTYMGAGVAMTISTALQALLIYLYISCSSTCVQTWRGFSSEAFKDWGPYLEIALPGVWMNTEYFVGESLTLAASMLADPDTCLSALSIYQLTQTTCYQIPSGLRMAISGRVGNQLGAAQPAEAAVAEKAGLRLILLWLTIPATLLLIFTRQWGLLFTQNVAVLQLLDTLVWPMLIYSSLDAVLAYIVGVLTSCGQQSISGRWAIGAYLGVSFPLALLFGFVFRWGVFGLCAGHCLGKICHVVPCMFAMWRIDWDRESKRAIERVDQVSSSTSLVRR
mmetsp:Transcript_129977/g.308379  ORF Transcript_129977/g.308379 Transcript_129977/m.308379 type:complete len:471 (-) Transcript_129977:39-1451(-)